MSMRMRYLATPGRLNRVSPPIVVNNDRSCAPFCWKAAMQIRRKRKNLLQRSQTLARNFRRIALLQIGWPSQRTYNRAHETPRPPFVAAARHPGLAWCPDQLLAVVMVLVITNGFKAMRGTKSPEFGLRRLPDSAGRCRSPTGFRIMARSLSPPRLGPPRRRVHSRGSFRRLERDHAPLLVLPAGLRQPRYLLPRRRPRAL